MQTKTPVGVMMIAAAALIATSAEAGLVRVSQEMTRGQQDFFVKGFVEAFARSEMAAAEIYDYNGQCPSAYGGTATVFRPEPNATVMAVVDTSEGRTLFTVHHFPMDCFDLPPVGGGTATMLFLLDFDDDMACLVRDDPTVDQADCAGGNKATTRNTWIADFTDGFVLGTLDGRWRLDASFLEVRGISGVIVRGSGGDITGLGTDRTIRFDNALEVGVDVKPGGEPNCLNTDGNGVIPVAILGSADFDVTEIDTSTLDFAGTPMRVRGNGNQQCSIEHLDDDGHPDLTCQFVDDPTAWRPGDAMAAVSGELFDSTPFYGEDSICIRPPA
jgi:hypothetical protein